MASWDNPLHSYMDDEALRLWHTRGHTRDQAQIIPYDPFQGRIGYPVLFRRDMVPAEGLPGTYKGVNGSKPSGDHWGPTYCIELINGEIVTAHEDDFEFVY